MSHPLCSRILVDPSGSKLFGSEPGFRICIFPPPAFAEVSVGPSFVPVNRQFLPERSVGRSLPGVRIRLTVGKLGKHWRRRRLPNGEIPPGKSAKPFIQVWLKPSGGHPHRSFPTEESGSSADVSRFIRLSLIPRHVQSYHVSMNMLSIHSVVWRLSRTCPRTWDSTSN